MVRSIIETCALEFVVGLNATIYPLFSGVDEDSSFGIEIFGYES